MDTDEIREEIEHYKALIKEYRKVLRSLELKSAKYGLHVPPYVEIEITEIIEKIQQYNTRISDLEKGDEAQEGSNLLTEREKQILSILLQGLSIDEISSKLIIKEQTVKTHMRSIYRKFGTSNRGDAVKIAIEKGLIDAND